MGHKGRFTRVPLGPNLGGYARVGRQCDGDRTVGRPAVGELRKGLTTMWSISKREAAHAGSKAAAAWYPNEGAAQAAADRLDAAGIPGGQVSMVGRRRSSHAELQGYSDPGSDMNVRLLPATLGGASLGLLAGAGALLLAPQMVGWGAAPLPSALPLLTLSLAAGAGIGAFASWIARLDIAEGAHARYTGESMRGRCWWPFMGRRRRSNGRAAC